MVALIPLFVDFIILINSVILISTMTHVRLFYAQIMVL